MSTGNPVDGDDRSASVDGADDRLERGRDDVGVEPDAPEHPVATIGGDRALDVCRCDGVATRGQRVLGIVEHPYVVPDGGDRVDEGGDGAVPLAGQLLPL